MGGSAGGFIDHQGLPVVEDQRHPERFGVEEPDPLVLRSTSAHYGLKTPRIRKELDRGKKVFCEVVLMALASMLGLAGIAGQYAAEHSSALESYRRGRAHDLLHETVQALHSYPFDSLPEFHGSAIHEADSPEHSDFKVEIAVTASENGRLRITTVLRDTKTRQQITELVTYRGRT
ncbi:MAG: hypothetical protein ACYTKC_01530 [Planctomycetota bacterium]|jgi:hypothetical protein